MKAVVTLSHGQLIGLSHSDLLFLHSC